MIASLFLIAMFFYSDQNNCSYSTGNNLKTRLTRQVPLVEQQLLTLPKHLSSSPVFNGVRVTQSLVLCVCFVDRWYELRLSRRVVDRGYELRLSRRVVDRGYKLRLSQTKYI